jgi:hypothetical protein
MGESLISPGCSAHLWSQLAPSSQTKVRLHNPGHLKIGRYPTHFPPGTAAEVIIGNSALDRAPLRGVIQVAVKLVDFEDGIMSNEPVVAQHFQDLFLSGGSKPVHPSAFDRKLNTREVKISNMVYRMWPQEQPNRDEYYLMENRTKIKYNLPGPFEYVFLCSPNTQLTFFF